MESILTSYTAQLEEYERSCGTFTTTIVASAIALLTLAFSASVYWPKIVAFMGIPCLEVVFSFVFSHYTRRIAFYRGYCMYLELRLNGKNGSSDFFFHKKVYEETMEPFGKSGMFLKVALYGIPVVCSLGVWYFAIQTRKFWICCIISGLIGIASEYGIHSFLGALDKNDSVVCEMRYLESSPQVKRKD